MGILKIYKTCALKTVRGKDLETVTFAMALVAGVGSIASPCVLPLLPGVMAYSTERNRLTPLAIVIGLTATFTAMGIASAVFGSFFMEYMDQLKLISGIFIILMGLYLLSEVVEMAVLKVWQLVPTRKFTLSNADDGSFLGGFLLGASLGIVWIPCVGPILALILMLVAQSGAAVYGASLLMVYSLGLAIPMLAIAYSSNYLTDKVRGAAKYSIVIRRIAGIILLIVGFNYLLTLGILPFSF
jgi:cytochrome c-type biogenesis protein